MINLRQPLPSTNVWTALPDYINLIINRIYISNPELIVECGSGFSSLILGYFLEKRDKGTLLSLEHDKKYYEHSKKLIEQHGLEGYVDIIYAPLKEIDINGKLWLWYNIKFLEKVKHIDMLLIDGPSSNIQKNARYPAVPILINRLSDGSEIIVDDYIRQEDYKTVKMWLEDFKFLTLEEFQTKNGAAILFKNKIS